MVLLVVLILSQIDFMIGTAIGPKGNEEVAKGFVGYNGKIMKMQNQNHLFCFFFFLFFFQLRSRGFGN